MFLYYINTLYYETTICTIEFRLNLWTWESASAKTFVNTRFQKGLAMTCVGIDMGIRQRKKNHLEVNPNISSLPCLQFHDGLSAKIHGPPFAKIFILRRPTQGPFCEKKPFYLDRTANRNRIKKHTVQKTWQIFEPCWCGGGITCLINCSGYFRAVSQHGP